MKPIAIVGLSTDTKQQLPEDDDWQSWQLAWDLEPIPNVSRYFEIHRIDTVEDEDLIGAGISYRDWLRNIDLPIVMVEAYKDIPMAERFPFEEICKLHGMERGYFESSIAYMLAQAFYEGSRKCGLWGVNLAAGGEWEYQRPNLAYLMGLFRAQGMSIRLPKNSALWCLCELDGQPVPAFDDPNVSRFHLEYHIGKQIGAGKEVKNLRPDLLKSLWTDPPRYGHQKYMPEGYTDSRQEARDAKKVA